MASISIAGSVTGREGEPAVTVRTFNNGTRIAKFSVIDTEYVYAKNPDDKIPQYYNVEVFGKAAEIAEERATRKAKVAVHGQLVKREYSGKTYLDVKNARVQYLEPRTEAPAADPFASEAPF